MMTSLIMPAPIGSFPSSSAGLPGGRLSPGTSSTSKAPPKPHQSHLDRSHLGPATGHGHGIAALGDGYRAAAATAAADRCQADGVVLRGVDPGYADASQGWGGGHGAAASEEFAAGEVVVPSRQSDGPLVPRRLFQVRSPGAAVSPA